jgi:hypothetical protein
MKLIGALLITVACVPASRHPERQQRQQPAQAKPSPVRNEPPCALVTKTATLKRASQTLPPGVTEDEALNGAVQLFVQTSMPIASKDSDAHTIITGRVDGQTLTSTCRINMYRQYVFRIAVIGRTMYVDTDCWGSEGWESYVRNGIAMPANRGTLIPCTAGTLVSEQDAGIPAQLIEGAIAYVELRRTEMKTTP